MKGSLPQYALAFRRQAVAEVRLGKRTQKEISEALGVSSRQIRRWMREAEAEEAAPPVDPVALQKRIAELERENEALREANRFFVKRRRKPMRTTS